MLETYKITYARNGFSRCNKRVSNMCRGFDNLVKGMCNFSTISKIKDLTATIYNDCLIDK